MTHDVFELTQASFRGRNDDGSESAATWKAAADTNWSQPVDENFRVRFLVQETGAGTAGSSDTTFELQYNLGGAGWNNVTGSSSVVRSSASSSVADGADTTQQVGSGTFVSPNSGFDEVDGVCGGAALDFAGDDEVEVEFCVQIRSADVNNSDTIQLRVTYNTGTALTYSQTPTVTVVEANEGTVGVTFPLPTASLSGNREVPGTVSSTFPIPSASHTGNREVPGDVSATFPIPTASLSGVVASVIGSLAASFPLFAMSTAGGVEHSGTVDPTFPVPTLSMPGESSHQATLSVDFPIPTASMSGNREVPGDVSATFLVPTLSLPGESAHPGDVSATFPLPTLSLSGNIAGGGPDVTGTIAATFPLPSADLSGNREVPGTIAATLPLPTLSLSGESSHQANVDAAFPLPTTALSGNREVPGDIASTFPIPTTLLSGVIGGATVGTLSVQFAPPSVNLSGYAWHDGGLAASFPAFSVSLSAPPPTTFMQAKVVTNDASTARVKTG